MSKKEKLADLNNWLVRLKLNTRFKIEQTDPRCKKPFRMVDTENNNDVCSSMTYEEFDAWFFGYQRAINNPLL